MKLISELKFLFNWFTKDDLLYFYEQLEERIAKTAKHETVDNDKLQGMIWKIMLVTIERALPVSRRYTRISNSEREKFMNTIQQKMNKLNEELDTLPLKSNERDSIIFSLHCLKFLLALSKHDELFK